MKYRKHILAAIFGAMLLFYVGDWLLKNVLQGPLQTRRARTALLEKRIRAKRRELARACAAGKQLVAWWSQSLPSDGEVARSLYQAWLLELVGHVGLANPNVDPGEPINRSGLYRVLPFTVRGRGTLGQLTKFLFEFYRAGHLHQVRALGITPLPKTDELTLSISIEALVLAGADRKDRLTTERSDRLASDGLEDYRVIEQRNLFGVGGPPEAIQYAVLTKVTYVDDRPEVTFTLQTTDEKIPVGVGDRLEIGSFRARVVEINGADVIIESDGQRWLLTLGDRLIDAYALPPEF